MKDEYKRIMACVECIQKKVNFHPKVALVLGSGLGDYGDNIDIRYRVDYAEIDNFPISTVEGHQGRFLFGYIKDVPVVVMQGRIHYYEGYSMSDVVLPIRLMHLMGAEILMLTNSSGGLNPDFVPGDLMMITDQISTFVPSPLIGKNIDELGTRFPDMTHIYDRSLQQMIRDVAKDMDFSLKEGVYIQFTGPNYESPAEVQMARLLGADAVAMSTACEAVAAKHMGMRICGISCISNMAAGITGQPLSHEEVKAAGERVAPVFSKLVTESIVKMGQC
ncbi:MAG: purine-nucleoside phosphorylase [Frisingicoccus sp.]|uniref:purine-nucleoside phosphorylase n=1 Tax=Frisingicoccus sp. TaxID=1918627 RepID=UPI0025C48AA2|nr:purine-nucleoside phosphorylase [Frisingicoccus sp.]MDY5956156.1 purine-nucleoside phosphorylase [Frisingicoccus sp.]